MAVAFLPGGDGPAAHAAAVIERAADVHVQASLVPAAQAQAHAAVQFIARALAHEVHRGRRVAGGREQAVGAAQYFDALVKRGVEVAVLDAVGQRQAEAVALEVGDVEAAGGEIHAVGFHLFHDHAGGVGQDLVDVVQAEVVHPGAGDDADRLRGLARGQFQAGGGIGGAGRVVVGLLPGDFDRVELGEPHAGIGEGGGAGQCGQQAGRKHGHADLGRHTGSWSSKGNQAWRLLGLRRGEYRCE